MKTLTQEKVALVLDLVYYNATHAHQKSFTELAIQAKISYVPFKRIISILKDMNLLKVTGTCRNTTYYWNTEMAPVNSAMVRKIHELYTGKPVDETPKHKLTLERAIEFLIEKGWRGKLERSFTEGLITTTEVIDLTE